MKTILCVDDIQSNLFTLEALFESHYNDKYKIITASSGEEALGILLSSNVDLILLDVMMPELDGYETAKLILKNKNTKDIPIIFLTAKEDDETIAECYRVGGVDYLSKPYNALELFVRVNFHLKLKENERILKDEKSLVQAILDTQDNLLFVTDGESISYLNREFLNFFDVESVTKFQNKYNTLCETFLKEDGYFHLDVVNKGKNWIESLYKKLKTNECLVLINNINTNLPRSFTIKVNKFDNRYLISLTDITELDIKAKAYEYDASYDNLTNIFNRLKLNEILEYKIKDSKKNKTKFSLIIFDIDYFKSINDTYGHLVGDSVLVHLSTLVKKHIRESDIFARWGGEEFVLLLSNTDIDKAYKVAQNLRKIIEKEHFDQANHITCSFGVSEYITGDSINSILQRADNALYKAKSSGRNCVFKSET